MKAEDQGLPEKHTLFSSPVDLCPQEDSNLRAWFRRPMLYPLSYGGMFKAKLSLRFAYGDE